MKILFVSQEYPPETGWGGIGTYVWIAARALVRGGHEVHVLSVARGAKARDVSDDGVWVHRRPVVSVRGLGRVTGMPVTSESLMVAASGYRAFKGLGATFDVVEFPGWKAEGFFFFLLRHPLPVVVRLASLAFQVLPLAGLRGMDARLAIAMEEFTIRRADLVTSPAQQADVVSERLGWARDRIVKIPFPVMVPPDPGPPPSGSPRILFAGRFEPRKSPETIIRAAPKVLSEFPDAAFVFVGRDSPSGGHVSYRAWLESVARELGVLHALEFVDGWRPEGVTREMPRASLCVVPSRSESFGYVAAEASSFGRPVIASRVTGLSEVVCDGITGRLVSPAEPEEWAEAIVSLLRDPEAARCMGREGRAFVAAHFAPDVVAERMVDGYAEAVRRFSGASGRRSLARSDYP